jgi:quercetin dioxygenase-like cupin family protein
MAATAAATGSRSFQVLLGPDNGSVRATLFAGFIPPGRAPWHYHLYDEIVWVYRGSGRLHLGEDETELRAGSAFRLRPRDLHIVENTSPDDELAVIGIFTPAGSPSAAYLPPGSTYEYGVTAR